MRNWIALKERYLRDKLPIRLGNLASNLARIKSQCQDVANRESGEMLLQESKYFIEWTAAEAEVETAAQLVELQIQLARWQYRWATIWDDSQQRMMVAQQASIWSERVLDMSGLLSEI